MKLRNQTLERLRAALPKQRRPNPSSSFSFDGCNVQFVFGESFSFLSLTFRTELLPEFAIQRLRPS